MSKERRENGPGAGPVNTGAPAGGGMFVASGSAPGQPPVPTPAPRSDADELAALRLEKLEAAARTTALEERVAELMAMVAGGAGPAAAGRQHVMPAQRGTSDAALDPSDPPLPHRVFASRDCPEQAPTVCGIDFPKQSDPVVLDAEGKPVMEGDDSPRRAYQKGKVQLLTRRQVAAIRAKLAEPLHLGPDGRLISGKVANMDGERQLLGPLGKWLHIEPVQANERASEREAELSSLNGQLVQLYRLVRDEDANMRRSADLNQTFDRTSLRSLESQIAALEERRTALVAGEPVRALVPV